MSPVTWAVIAALEIVTTTPRNVSDVFSGDNELACLAIDFGTDSIN